MRRLRVRLSYTPIAGAAEQELEPCSGFAGDGRSGRAGPNGEQLDILVESVILFYYL